MFSDTEKELLEAQQRHKDALARGDEYHLDILGKTIDFLQKN